MFDIEAARLYKSRCRHDGKWYGRVGNIGQIAALVCLLSTVVIYWADLYCYSEGNNEGNLPAAVLPGGCLGHLYFRFVWNIAAIRGDERIIVLAFFGAAVILSLHIFSYVGVLQGDTFLGLAVLMFFESIGVVIGIRLIPREVWDAPYVVLMLGAILRLGITFLLLAAKVSVHRKKMLETVDILLWAAEKYGWSEHFNIVSLSNEEWEKLAQAYINETKEKGENCL